MFSSIEYIACVTDSYKDHTTEIVSGKFLFRVNQNNAEYHPSKSEVVLMFVMTSCWKKFSDLIFVIREATYWLF